MIEWEAWCYRCRGRDSGLESNEHAARERVHDFHRDHQGSCGAGVSIGHMMNTHVPASADMVTITGDGYTQTGGQG